MLRMEYRTPLWKILSFAYSIRRRRISSLFSKVMSIFTYFKPAEKDQLLGEALQSATGDVSPTQVCVARTLNAEIQESLKPKTRQRYSEKIKQTVGFHANKHGVTAARKWAVQHYRGFQFKRETVRDWKQKYKKMYIERGSVEPSSVNFKSPGRPSMISEELATEIRVILQNLRTAGCGISRKTVIAVGEGVLSAKSPDLLRKNGGTVSLSIKWARGILTSLNWSKRRGTTAKREMNPALYEELSFTWKKNIATLVLDHKIPDDLIFNLDQTPLAYVCASKTTMAPRGASTVRSIFLAIP